MKKGLILAFAVLLAVCSKPDPYDIIRDLRRQYELSIDLTVSSSGELSYELRARNLSSSKSLQEVTAFVRVLDKDKKPLWSKQVEIDVSDTGSYATATSSFKEQVGPLDYEFYELVLAPDDDDSKFATYREFMRVSR